MLELARLWRVRFSKSTILLILQLLPRLLPHKPMRLKAGLLIPTSLRAAKSWRWQTVGCASSPLPTNGDAAANPSSSNNWPAVAVWGTGSDFSKAGSFHATIKSPQEGSANRFGFYLGYNDPGSGLVHRLRFGRLVLADLHRWRQRRLVQRQSYRCSERQRRARHSGLLDRRQGRHTDRGWPERHSMSITPQ